MMTEPKDYSQNGEQVIIQKLLDKAGIKTGRLLDIGAYVPDTFSNSRALLDAGWRGVLVEPSPRPFAALLDYYGKNPKVDLVNTALNPDGGWLDFYDSHGDALSSAQAEHVLKWASAGVPYTRYHLKSVAIADLFDHFGYDFTFINLDVEGFNGLLFACLPFGRLPGTQIICVEHDQQADAMTNLARPYGFAPAHVNGENLILTRIP